MVAECKCTMQNLHQIVAGRFYYRPLDQVLHRLGDNPLKSQPPHLLRLAIIRETGIEGRHTHYCYFPYRWHDKLIKAGLGKPVGGPKKAHVKGKRKEEEKQREKEETAPKRVTVATDDLGFSLLTRRLLKGDGSCTIKKAQEKLAAPESAHILKGRCMIETTEGGRSSVRWFGWNRAPKVSGTGMKNTDGTLRRGRPPNWLRETRKRAAEDVEVKEMPSLILEMKNNIVATDGNLWFPEGTEIPTETQKLASSVRRLPTQPGAIESVEFERMFVPLRQILQAQRAGAARQKRLSRIEKEYEFPRFTAEQKELAAKRLDYRRRRAVITALAKCVAYVDDNDAWDAPSDNEMEMKP